MPGNESVQPSASGWADVLDLAVPVSRGLHDCLKRDCLKRGCPKRGDARPCVCRQSTYSSTSTVTVEPAGAYGTVSPATGTPSTASFPRAPGLPEFLTVIW